MLESRFVSIASAFAATFAVILMSSAMAGERAARAGGAMGAGPPHTVHGASRVTASAGGECVPAWHPFPAGSETGMSGSVEALTVWNGDVIAGGAFITAGGQTVNRIARWDGSAWQPFSSGGQIGVNNIVRALTVWNGDLIACGDFTTAGGQIVNRIARWDGAAWHPFSSGGQIGVDQNMLALMVWNGDPIAGGNFITAGGQTVNKIARWDGSAWHPLTSGGQLGVSGNFVEALMVWNGELIAAGSFFTAGGQLVSNIARWDGAAWHPFTSGGQTGVNNTVRALTVWNGSPVAGGDFTTAGGQTVNRIATWDGSAWHPFTACGEIGVNWIVFALTVWNGDLIAGGDFITAGGQIVNQIARWNGVSGGWHRFTSGGQIGVNNAVRALSVWNGDVIAGGFFTTAGGQAVNRIARWDGCLPILGACCINGVALDTPIPEASCLAVGGHYQGDFTMPGEVACPASCAADLTNDGVVDVIDLLQLLSNWGPCP